MYHEKRVKKGTQKKSVALILSLALLYTVIVGGAIAFIVDKTGAVTNVFTLQEVPNKIVETTTGGVKSNVYITNTSDKADAYIRAAVIMTWAEINSTTKEPTGNVYHTVPVEDEDYSVVWGTSDYWVKGADGFWYYTKPVPAGKSTEELIGELQEATGAEKPASSAEGCEYVLSVEIVSQSIQADGELKENGTVSKPVVLAWGVDNGGSVTGVSGTTLQIQTEEASA